MSYCSIQNFKKYQALEKASGLPTTRIAPFVSDYYDKYSRFPYLDEIPHANSTDFVKNKLKVDNYNYSKIKNILKETESESIEEAMIKINNEYRDLQTKIIPLEESAFIDIRRRPSEYYINNHNFEINPEPVSRERSKAIITTMLDKLQKFYGIQIINVNNDVLQKDFKHIITDSHLSSAFVYNGNIYVNTDVASIDAPIHELLHIFLGGMRYQEPDLYMSIVGSLSQLPNFENLIKPYRDRTMIDACEELFVKEFAKYLTTGSKIISSLSDLEIDQIFYNITRIIDSSLMGRYSVASIDIGKRYNFSINKLANILESNITTPKYLGSLQDASVSRKILNLKKKMLKNGELIENCI